MSQELCNKTAAELSAMLETKKITSVELVKNFASRVHAIDGKVNAFISFDEQDALTQAQASDARRAKGQAYGALDGVPVGIKDVIAVTGQRLTCCSKILEKFVSPYDATVTEKLKGAGAILWGRLNMDEFAMGSSTENSAFKTTSNPWDLERIPGGSSGGSAACVAAGMAPLSLGSDTGGSIRQPAALCGIVGLKPTYGTVSRFGLAAFASSLDQIGPFARTVEDAAILLQVISGHDKRDSTSCRIAVPDFKAELTKRKGPWKIGLPREFFGEGLPDEMRAAVQTSIDFYKSNGCEIVEVSLPHSELAVPVYYIIATAEASSNLARYDGVLYSHRSNQAQDIMEVYCKSRAEGFGEEVKRRIILGTYVLSSGYYDAFYLRAQKVRSLIREDFTKAFQQVDAILTPTTPTPAFKKGEKKADPLSMYLSDIYTISVNLAGLPGLSMPCGFSKTGLPLGVQLIGKPFGEADLLAMAHQYDDAHRYGRKYPENLK